MKTLPRAVIAMYSPITNRNSKVIPSAKTKAQRTSKTVSAISPASSPVVVEFVEQHDSVEEQVHCESKYAVYPFDSPFESAPEYPPVEYPLVVCESVLSVQP